MTGYTVIIISNENSSYILADVFSPGCVTCGIEYNGSCLGMHQVIYPIHTMYNTTYNFYSSCIYSDSIIAIWYSSSSVWHK